MALSEDKRASEKKEVEISLSEYKNGKEAKRYYRIDTLYFQKNFIDKDCWEVRDKIS